MKMITEKRKIIEETRSIKNCKVCISPIKQTIEVPFIGRIQSTHHKQKESWKIHKMCHEDNKMSVTKCLEQF